MCLLLLAKPNYTPKKKYLNCACDSNPHGFGFAFHTGKKIFTFHSLDKNETIENFYKMRAKYPEAWAMFHARYATHGSVKVENCHPFKVANSAKTILGHNGILPLKPKIGDDRSDTKLFAEDFLPVFGLENLDDESFFNELEDFCAGSKLVIFTTEPKMENQIYVINENLGHWKNGVWYSNNSYMAPKVHTVAKVEKDWFEWEYSDELESIDELGENDFQDWQCLRCGKLTDCTKQFCAQCSACLDCGAYLSDCFCYDPNERAFSKPFGQLSH
jgi:hypothetical protein